MTLEDILPTDFGKVEEKRIMSIGTLRQSYSHNHTIQGDIVSFNYFRFRTIYFGSNSDKIST